MSAILLRASFFLLMVALGYAVKKTGVLTKEDGVSLARIILYITLPCAILSSFRTFVFDWTYMLIPRLSFLANWLMLATGWLITRRKSREERIYYMLELPAYNIGNFTLPFVSGILGSTGVVATCLFDMGNSPMCLGFNLLVTTMAIGEKRKENPILSILSIFKKPPFTVYFIMLVLSIAGLAIPSVIFDFADMIAPANGPMAMVMIGLMLEFSLDRTRLKEVLSVNGIRLALALAIALGVYFLTPFPYEVRKAVAITAFAPISSASPAFVADLKGDVELVGFASTVSIILALALMPMLFALL